MKTISHFVFLGCPLLAFIISLSGPAHADDANTIEYMTEEYPPFNYTENDTLKGMSVDVLVRLFDKMNLGLTKNNIKVYPWARGYQRTVILPNTMLFSTTRTTEREKLFRWVGPVAPNRVVIFALKDSPIEINSAQDLQKYKYGVIRDDIGQQLLVKAGVTADRIEAGAKVTSIISKMKHGRIDAWAYSEPVAKWFIKQHGYRPDYFKVSYVLMQGGDLYFAFNKDTSDKIINRFQTELDSLKQKDSSGTSEYSRIQERY